MDGWVDEELKISIGEDDSGEARVWKVGMTNGDDFCYGEDFAE